MQLKLGMLFFTISFTPRDYDKYGVKAITNIVEDIKLLIPASSRNYYRDTNEWEIHNDYRDTYDRILKKHINTGQQTLDL
jgi:hypothetical protein